MKRRWLQQLIVAGAMTTSSSLLVPGATHAQQYCPPQPCPPGSIDDYYSPTQPEYSMTPMRPSPQPRAESGNESSSDTTQPVPQPSSDTQQPLAQQPSFSDLAMNAPPTSMITSGLAAGPSSALDTVGGYIDDALVRTRMRFRFDSVDGGDSDRAEFLYGTYNSARFPIVGPILPINGPALVAPRRLDYEEVSTYLELALTRCFSGFVEIGARWNNIEPLPNGIGIGGDPDASGLNDMNAGFKVALHQSQADALTFQFKVLIPTGDEQDLLGTGHTSLMPGLLYREQLTSKLSFFGEVQDWIALNATEIVGAGDPNAGKHFGGNVIRYGLGTGYDLCQSWRCGRVDERLTAVNEVVGWTVLDGFGVLPRADLNNVVYADMDGDTIVNFKSGLRYTAGRTSLYVGYGQAITDDVWYDDIIRIEMQQLF